MNIVCSLLTHALYIIIYIFNWRTGHKWYPERQLFLSERIVSMEIAYYTAQRGSLQRFN
jgi:hypothetical protein